MIYVLIVAGMVLGMLATIGLSAILFQLMCIYLLFPAFEAIESHAERRREAKRKAVK